MKRPLLLAARVLPVLGLALLLAAGCAGGVAPSPTTAPAKPAATAAIAATSASTATAAPTKPATPPTTAATTAPATAASPSAVAAAGSVAAGQQLYQTNCTACHGPRAEGGIKLADATTPELPKKMASAYSNNNTLISRAILEGKDEAGKDLDDVMPTFQGKLSPEQVADIIAYLKSLQ